MVAGESTFGAWISIDSIDVVDILQQFPYDWFVFDTEHSPLSMEKVSHMIQAIDETKVAPLIRVGQCDQYLIKSALDMGAHGVVVPLVNSHADAEAAVSYSKYPPMGIRGVAPRKAADYGSSTAEYIRKANNETILVVQIETKMALENVDSILGVPGVDVAFVGPSDLTMSLGLLDDRSNATITEAMKKVVERCAANRKVAGTMALTADEVERATNAGFKFVGLSSDTRYLVEGAKAFLRSVGRL